MFLFLIKLNFLKQIVIFFVTKHKEFLKHEEQRWSPRGHILKSLALASKVKSLALVSRPQVLENWPVLGSRTALFFELLKFREALENFFGKFLFVEIA